MPVIEDVGAHPFGESEVVREQGRVVPPSEQPLALCLRGGVEQTDGNTVEAVR